MWQKPLQKTIFTLRVDGYAPEIVALTDPLLKSYAAKIGAAVNVITERKFPDFPPVYEKFQIYELAQAQGNDWNIYIDSDALIHPDMYDVTNHLSKDTVCHHAKDMADQRWRYDRFFLRDGRHIGSGNWFACASDWCIELWHPLDDLLMEEAVSNISPLVNENHGRVTPEHLIDDYTCSRNIAKYGLKFTTVTEINAKLGFVDPKTGMPLTFFWHQYLMPAEQKVVEMGKVIKSWGL